MDIMTEYDDGHGMTDRLVVFRLCGPGLDGKWHRYPAADRMDANGVELVATGALEWEGDRCAEVWVPADRLDEWRFEWEVDRV